MKKRYFLVIVFVFLICLQLVVAQEVKNLGNGITKIIAEDGSMAWRHKNNTIKTQSSQGLVKLFGASDSKTPITTYVIDDLKVLGNSIVIKENLDAGSLQFHQIINGKEVSVAFFSAQGNVEFDSSKKKLEFKMVWEEEGKTKQHILSSLIVPSPENIKVFNSDNKIQREILKTGENLMYDKNSVVTVRFNPLDIFKVFKPTRKKLPGVVGWNDIKKDKISQIDFEGLERDESGFLKVNLDISNKGVLVIGNKTNFYYLFGGEIKLQNDKALSIKKIKPSSNYKTLDYVYFTPKNLQKKPFFFQNKGDNLIVEIVQKEKLFSILAKQKGKNSSIIFNESKIEQRKDEDGFLEEKLTNLRNHEISCLDKECEIITEYRLEDDPLIKIKGLASYLKPIGKEKEKEKKLYLESSLKPKKEPVAHEVFDSTNFYDMSIGNVVIGKISRSDFTGFLRFLVLPLNDAVFADVKFSSKSKSPLPLNIIINSHITTMENKGYLMPFFDHQNFIIEENKNNLIAINTKPGAKILYKENGKKLFNLKNGLFYILKELNEVNPSFLNQQGSSNFQKLNPEIIGSFLGKTSGPTTLLLGKEEITIRLKEGGNYDKHAQAIEVYPNAHASKYKYYNIEEFMKHSKYEPLKETSITFEDSKNDLNWMLFQHDKVMLSDGSRWYDHGVSFKTYLYQEINKQKLFIPFECKIGATKSQHQCYLNNNNVTFKAETKVKTCKNDKECPTGQTCVKTSGNSKTGFCTLSKKCESLNIPGFGGPIKILFVNDGIVKKEIFKDLVQEIIGFSESGSLRPVYNIPSNQQMFMKEPFASTKDKFTILYMDDQDHLVQSGVLAIPDRTVIGQQVKKSCPEAHYTIVLSDSFFGSFAWLSGGFSGISKSDLKINSNVVPHEFAHAAFGLADEYFTEKKMSSVSKSKWINQHMIPSNIFWNCVANLENAKRKGWDENTYDLITINNWQGCGGICPEGCSQWYKTGQDSIMSRANYFDNFTPFVQQRMKEMIETGKI